MPDIRPMSDADAIVLQALMAGETPEYLAHFTAFAEPGALRRKCSVARQDAFFTLLDSGRISGFFCLRGLDQGYVRPSFGVYVASSAQGRGLARAALQRAVVWCRQRGVPMLMLKVSVLNARAYRLYESCGFVPTGLCPDSGHTIMERRID